MDNDILKTRFLEEGDFDKGYLSLLSQLTNVGAVSKADFGVRFREMKAMPDTYYTVVIEDTTKKAIIAAASLIVEKKFARSCGKCGHIEDVVVDETYRGKQLGLRVITRLKELAAQLGCYKVILACSDDNVAFYERCGFKKHEVEMAWYIPTKANL